MLQKLKKEFQAHKYFYYLLTILFILSAFVRVYRTEITLQFFYDMGRDAIQIWELIHKGDFFLIGPTTGIAGIFRGPYFYYLITPFYWLGNGNPVWPANFLALTTVAASMLLYYLAYKFTNSRLVGVFTVILTGFSFYLMRAARWLSNPTPMMLLSMLYVFVIYNIINNKNIPSKPWRRGINWIALSFIAGLSLFHFGSSGELFYFPTIFILALLYRRQWQNKKIFIFSLFAFSLTILPLVVFDFRNNFLLYNNIKNFLFNNDTFKASFAEIFRQRLDLYRGVFWGNVFPGGGKWVSFFGYSLIFLTLLHLPNLLRNKYFLLIGTILAMPIIGLMFFQGNAVYGYYLTGYFYIFIIFLAIILGAIWKSWVGKLYVIAFFVVFLNQNVPIIKSNIMDNVDGPSTIAFKPQKQALDWIYTDSKGEKFNVDVYVPPVIPYAYDYLFLWYGNELGHTGKVDEQVPLLYTLYEEDPPHPERLQAWLDRQKGIGDVEYSQKFAGITVQRRHRIVN